MKLSALNTAVRNLKGAPQVAHRFVSTDGSEIILEGLEITKQSLLDSLKRRFDGERTAETGLTIRGHRLCHETAADRVTAPPEEDGDDIAEMFG